MFGALEDYKSKSFYEKHKTIQFDTLTEQAEYEIIAVFKTRKKPLLLKKRQRRRYREWFYSFLHS